MDFMTFILKEFRLFFLSAMPIIELRGAIPVGMLMGLNPIHCAVVSYLGSMFPVPFILLGMKPVLKWARKREWARPFFESIVDRTLKKVNHFETFSFWGLLFFVAIPLPTTGVWTGSLASCLLGMPTRKSFLSIALGNLVAAILVTTGSSAVGFFL